MKNPVTKWITVFLVAATLAAPSAFAKKGGVGDGGNLTPGRLLYPEEIETLIQNIKNPLRYALMRMDAMYNGPDLDKREPGPMSSLLLKMFRGPKTIFAALDEAKFDPIPTGTCFDPEGNPTDASADIETMSVCVALAPLSKKLHEASGPVELLALSAHEVSHLVGASKEEAEILQSVIQTSAAPTIFHTVDEIVAQTKRSLDEAIGNFDLPKKFEPIGTATCPIYSVGIAQIFKINDDGAQLWSTLGMSALSRKASLKLFGAGLKAANVVNACYQGQGVKDENAEAFKGKDEISLNEFYRFKTHSPNGATLTEGVIRRLKPSDKAKIRLEINEIKAMLTEVRESVR